ATALAGCAAPEPQRARFVAALAAQDSATAALEGWCAANRLAMPATVSAAVLDQPPPPEPADARRLLGVSAEAALGYRHVRLSCGAKVLSVARNWYVPARLTPEMNAALATSRVPFGKVAAPLGFRRERLDTLPRRSRDCPAGTILGHRALLRLPDGRPLALLVECYTRANLRR
ncbi:hypothetical protein H7F53_03675, partial [Novosphingobium piscinae]|nr:hypothetical protein [Novosphingobium piscinae]